MLAPMRVVYLSIFVKSCFVSGSLLCTVHCPEKVVFSCNHFCFDQKQMQNLGTMDGIWAVESVQVVRISPVQSTVLVRSSSLNVAIPLNACSFRRYFSRCRASNPCPVSVFINLNNSSHIISWFFGLTAIPRCYADDRGDVMTSFEELHTKVIHQLWLRSVSAIIIVRLSGWNVHTSRTPLSVCWWSINIRRDIYMMCTYILSSRPTVATIVRRLRPPAVTRSTISCGPFFNLWRICRHITAIPGKTRGCRGQE